MLAFQLLTLLAAGSALVLLVKFFADSASLPMVFLWYPLLRLLTMAGVLAAQLLCKRAGFVSTGILFNTFLVHWVCALPELYAWLDRITGHVSAETMSGRL